MHTDYLRRIAAICLLALSSALVAPVAAEDDWRALWRHVLPDVEAPADPIEAEEVFWTYNVESGAQTRACLAITTLLTSGYQRQSHTGTATSATGDLLMDVFNYCGSVAESGVEHAALHDLLSRAGAERAAELIDQAGRGEKVPYSADELLRVARRINSRGMHIQRWKK